MSSWLMVHGSWFKTKGSTPHFTRKVRGKAQRSRRGFTLIEALVVLVVIAALTAAAVPTFMGWRTNVRNRIAKSSALAYKGAMDDFIVYHGQIAQALYLPQAQCALGTDLALCTCCNFREDSTRFHNIDTALDTFDGVIRYYNHGCPTGRSIHQQEMNVVLNNPAADQYEIVVWHPDGSTSYCATEWGAQEGVCEGPGAGQAEGEACCVHDPGNCVAPCNLVEP